MMEPKQCKIECQSCNDEECKKTLFDGTDAASEDWWRGYESGINQAIFHINKWLEDEVQSTGKFSDEKIQLLYNKIKTLKMVEKMWSDGCEKLQDLVHKNHLGIASDDLFDLVVDELQSRIDGF
jgi:hypothetical protein